MQVSIFKEVTTEEKILEIEKKAESYVGLYVEMSDPKQRKFIKDHATEIGDILKNLDRARIDLSKDYKKRVEAEALEIKSRLEIANKPFTDLLDEWKEERKRILDAEKQALEFKKRGLEHEEAISYNELFDLKREKEQAKAEAEKQLLIEEAKKQAAAELIAAKEQAAKDALIAEAKAKQDLIDAENKRLNDIEQAKQLAIAEKQRSEKLAIDAEARRVADVERAKQEEINKQKAEADRIEQEKRKREADEAYVISILTSIKMDLIEHCELTEAQARTVTLALKNNMVSHTAISF